MTMGKKHILIVPATNRNRLLLEMYLNDIKECFRYSYLRTLIWGKKCDCFADGDYEDREVCAPDFLLDGSLAGEMREWKRLFYIKKNHARLREYLRNLNLSLIIIGTDNAGIGRWVAFVAKELQLRTLVCQEGCRKIFSDYHYPFLLQIKRLLYDCWAKIYYSPGRSTQDYSDGQYLAVWGQYDLQCVINSKTHTRDHVFVVGDPRIKPISPTPARLIKRIIFLDLPISAYPEKSLNLQAHVCFRRGLLRFCLKEGVTLLYKPHPFASKEEINWIRREIVAFGNVELVTDGASEDLLPQADACISYPSTAMFGVLARAIPLILLNYPGSGIGRLLWDPVARYGAGVSIESADDLNMAFSVIKSDKWRADFMARSFLAATDVVGPLDGQACKRFASCVFNVLKQENIVK